jgi:hypothetical protein
MPPVLAALGDAEAAVERRIVIGGTARARVAEQLDQARQTFQ